MPQNTFLLFLPPLLLPFRSILTYSRIGGHVKTLTFCQGSHYLAIASDNGAIQLLSIEASKLPKSPKIQPIQSRYVLTAVKSPCRTQAASVCLAQSVFAPSSCWLIPGCTEGYSLILLHKEVLKGNSPGLRI